MNAASSSPERAAKVREDYIIVAKDAPADTMTGVDGKAYEGEGGPKAAAKALETQIWTQAKSIAEKYIVSPHTTDFAILFLPSEGLYAEVLRRPGLMEGLQAKHKVTLAGPTTMLALLKAPLPKGAFCISAATIR